MKNNFRTCTRISISKSEDHYWHHTFSCVKHDYMYGVLTFVFIFAPSANVLMALMGPAIGGLTCMLWGVVIFIVGAARVLSFVVTGDSHCVVNRAQPGVHSPNTASVFLMELRSGARQRVK